MSTPQNLIHELEEALSKGSAERRSKTLHRVTDLFVFGAGHFSDDHVAVFDVVFSRMISDLEASARAALAERLAGVPNAPPNVIRTLAFDDTIDVAGPVLSRSERLDNATLVENASSKSQQHLLAIAQRKSLAETVTDVLVERGNREVALSTVRNENAKFSEAGYMRLVKRSEGDDEFAQFVGARSEIPRHHFLKLLTKASHAVRSKLAAIHPEYHREIQHVVAEAASGIQAQAAARSRDYLAARTMIESLRAAGRLGESDVEAFARAGKFEETTVALATLCSMPIDAVERAMVHERPESILIIAKAAGFSWLTAKAVLLLRMGKRGMSPQSLEQCMADFGRLKRETAQQVLAYQLKRHQAGLPPAR
jgi:uncharacterized protein (DUF2336 family)